VGSIISGNAFAGVAADDRTDRRADDSSNRTADCANGRAGRATASRTNAGADGMRAGSAGDWIWVRVFIVLISGIHISSFSNTEESECSDTSAARGQRKTPTRVVQNGIACAA
jgi:hypothetical protein